MESEGTENGSKTVEIASRRAIYSVSFVKDGAQVLSGGVEGMLRCWRVDDGREVGQAIQAAGAKIFAAALSPDRKWLVCGLGRSESARDGRVQEGIWARVWDAQTRSKVLDVRGHRDTVFSVDFSPDSTKFATGSADKLAFIWSVAKGQKVVELRGHEGIVVVVRFSPTGDRIATATAKNGPSGSAKSIRIYDSNHGKRLLDIPFLVNGHVSSSLAWSADGHQIFAVSYSKVQCFDASSGSVLCQWFAPGDGSSASIALSHNQKFLVIVANKSLSFWDTVTHEQIGTVIEHASSVWSVALSPSDCCIATGEDNGKIISRRLDNIIPGSYIMVDLPLVYINDTAFKSWAQGDLTRAEKLLTEEIAYPFHQARALAQRALVRARLKRWSTAIVDAEESIKLQQSIIGYIANAMAHVSNGKQELAVPLFDLVFSFHAPTENKFLLLIKAVMLFELGKHEEATLRVESLINIVDDRSLYLTVRARMFLIRGNISLTNGDSEEALEFFRHASEAIPSQNDPYLVVISLIFGWDFDELDQAIQLHLQKCIKPFEGNGDAAMELKIPREAIKRYSTALSLKPSNPAGLLVKRSIAQAMLGSWEDALRDADEAIRADPRCPWGYERKHAALHGMRRFDDAINEFKCMLSLIEEFPDWKIHREKYFPPSQSETTIESVVREVSKICPLVLIDVESGRLCNRQARLEIFKADPKFKELVSSMTEVLDHDRIQQVVKKYFQYVMLSHVWAGEEPLFQDVHSAKSVWQLHSSPLNQKLQRFCEVVQKDGHRWAWSDTCCIDKTNSAVLNQSLTMMYKWYEASVATFVLLADVDSLSALGNLKKSKWMTRAWTAQELLAPKVVRFYDRNWRPYLGDTRFNHKESPEIVQELMDAIGVARETIITFHPDDLSVHEKLRLASTRDATVEEDVAYSLIGIFKSDIRPHYGEREAALGHLLVDIVARSGNVTVLDWVGKSSPYNSCLPATLRVYSQMPSAPPVVEAAEMNMHIAALRNSLPKEDAMLVHRRVMHMPPARFFNRRLCLPCIIFTVGKIVHIQDSGCGQETHYRAGVSGIGYVNFKTSDRLPLTGSLILVHPWIRNLRDPLDGFTWGRTGDDGGSPHNSPLRTVSAITLDDYTRALRLIVRLQQPFHALLLQQQLHGEFRRIAAEHEIVVPRLDPQIDFTGDIRIDVVEIL